MRSDMSTLPMRNSKQDDYIILSCAAILRIFSAPIQLPRHRTNWLFFTQFERQLVCYLNNSQTNRPLHELIVR